MSGHKTAGGGGVVGPEVTFGLLAAWAVHDLEEVAAVPGWVRGKVPELQERQGLVLAAAATAGTHVFARRLRRSHGWNRSGRL